MQEGGCASPGIFGASFFFPSAPSTQSGALRGCLIFPALSLEHLSSTLRDTRLDCRLSERHGTIH